MKNVSKHELTSTTTYVFAPVPVMNEDSNMATFLLWILLATRAVMQLDILRFREPAKEMVWRSLILELYPANTAAI